jgi:hypothetical protein
MKKPEIQAQKEEIESQLDLLEVTNAELNQLKKSCKPKPTK